MSGTTLVRLEYLRDVYAEGLGDALNNQDGRVALPGFDAAKVGLVNVRAMGDLFLRKVLFSPDPLDVSGNARLNRHARHGARRLRLRP